jgi:hypothetical protein
MPMKERRENDKKPTNPDKKGGKTTDKDKTTPKGKSKGY